MASQDKGLGPLAGQTVLYNNGGVVRPGIIYLVNADGTVNITQFVTGTAVVDQQNKAYDAGLSSGRWAYPQVI